jgi:hypothetical protein
LSVVIHHHMGSLWSFLHQCYGVAEWFLLAHHV